MLLFLEGRGGGVNDFFLVFLGFFKCGIAYLVFWGVFSACSVLYY